MFTKYSLWGNSVVKLLNYLNNASATCSIPKVQGEVDGYKYELIDKTDPRGLICGYATDCCMTIEGNGESCIRAGYEMEKSSFIIVEKSNTIYAQSWVWETEAYANNGNKVSVLVLDSIEIVGSSNYNFSDSIIEAYREIVDYYNSYYDIIIASTTGNKVPDNIMSLSVDGTTYNSYNIPGIREDLYSLVPEGVYSDLPDGVMVLKALKEVA
jgi:hypothetical protein